MNKKQSCIPTLVSGDSTAADTSLSKAILLNTYFFECFNTTVPPLAEGDVFHPQQYDFSNCPEELLCSEETILDQLKSLDTTKSTGIDEISATMLNTANSMH